MIREKNSLFLIFILLFCLSLPVLAPALEVRAESVPEAGAEKATKSVTEAGAEKATKSAPEDKNPANTALSQVWDSRFSEAEALEKEIVYYGEQIKTLVPNIKSRLENANNAASTLFGLYKVSRNAPNEQLTFIYQMRQQRSRLKSGVLPLEKMLTEISEKIDYIDLLQKDLIGIAKQVDRGEGISVEAEDKESLGQYVSRLNAAKKSLIKIKSSAEPEIKPFEKLIAKLGSTIEEINASLPEIWKNYYLTSSSISMETISKLPASASDWVSSIPSSLLFVFPSTRADWVTVAINFSLAFIFVGAMGVILHRGSRNFSDPWAEGVQRTVSRSWLWLTLGLSLITASSSNQVGSIYLSFALAGVLFLIWGIGAFSWRLRWAAKPELVGTSVPLVRFFPPAALGIFLLNANVPSRQLGVIWLLTMLVFIFLLWRLNKGQKSRRDNQMLLEKILYSSSFIFVFISLLVAIVGYPRLAILVYMLLFAIANALTLGAALADFSVMLVGRISDPEEMPVRNSFGQAIAIPLAWLISIVCIVPWLWAVPGARYIVDGFLQKGYTIGDASFNLSKILLIAALYVLFRSLVHLGKTSLIHLPDRMPHIERGVIPPLTTMFTYGMWTVFTLLAFSMVGVSFTSLAVVAGGLSVGIGFGMQNIFNNLISGIMLIFGRTILVGDYVTVGGTEGTVRDISIRSTSIETFEHALVYVPNSVIMSGQFINWTRGSRKVRRTIPVVTGYVDNPAEIAKMLVDIAKEHKHVLKNPAPFVRMMDSSSRDLNYNLIVTIGDFDYGGDTLSDLRFAVSKAFTENKVPLPIPEMELSLAGKISSEEITIK